MSRILPFRHWTAEEEQYLRAHYPNGDIAAIAAHLGRTLQAIKKHAQELHLQCGRYWTEADVAALVAGYGKVRTRELARQLGRNPNAVKLKAMKLGLDSNRYLTAEQIALVKELYLTCTAAEISERVFGSTHSASAVYKLAERLGLRKWPHWPPEVIERVRQLHAEGLTDADIARRMSDVFTGHERDARLQVKHLRRERLKLPCNVEAVKAAIRGNSAKQLKTLGLASLGELRSSSYRRYAVENGWPEDLRAREVQILNVLAARGVPMTTLELAEAIGANTSRTFRTGKRRVLLADNSKHGTYPANLAKRGLIVRHKGATGIAGSTSGCRDLYSLGPAALAILERRAACNQNVS